MRVGLRVLAGVASFWLAAPAWAVRPGISTGKAETSCQQGTTGGHRLVAKSVRGGYVWGVTLVCPTAPCDVTVFDSTSSTIGDGTARWEARVSANNGTYSETFTVPVVTDNGIAIEASTSSSVCVAYE